MSQCIVGGRGSRSFWFELWAWKSYFGQIGCVIIHRQAMFAPYREADGPYREAEVELT